MNSNKGQLLITLKLQKQARTNSDYLFKQYNLQYYKILPN